MSPCGQERFLDVSRPASLLLGQLQGKPVRLSFRLDEPIAATTVKRPPIRPVQGPFPRQRRAPFLPFVRSAYAGASLAALVSKGLGCRGRAAPTPTLPEITVRLAIRRGAGKDRRHSGVDSAGPPGGPAQARGRHLTVFSTRPVNRRPTADRFNAVASPRRRGATAASGRAYGDGLGASAERWEGRAGRAVFAVTPSGLAASTGRVGGRRCWARYRAAGRT